MELKIQELNPEAFARYGTVISQPARQNDASGPGWSWWGENAFLEGDGRPFGIGYLDLHPAEHTFDWAERHMSTMELVIPVGGDCLVHAGPPDYPESPEQLPALDRFEVFRVPEGQAVLFNRGVWHGAPIAYDRPCKAIVLLHKGTGERDAFVVRFPETPVKIRG